MRCWGKFISHCLAICLLVPIHSTVAISVRNKKATVVHLPSQTNQYRTKQPIIVLSSTASPGIENEQKKATTSSSSMGSATIPEEIFNLVKTIVGAGVLSLPAGIAQMAAKTAASNSSPSSGIVISVACALIALMGGISAYTFSLIARVCKMTKSDTYADCWKATRGPSLAWTIALISTLNCFAINLSFSMVLAETFRQLLSSAFELAGKVNPGLIAGLGPCNSRCGILLFLTVTSLMPLSCVKNLSSLAPFSLVGIIGTLYTAVMIGLRWFDGSYSLPNGRFLADLESVPSFPGGAGASMLEPLKNPKTLILASMLSTAFIAHFNAPKFYRDLKDSDIQPKRFHLGVVASSFAASIIFYCLVASLGYLTFGSATQGMILSNYSTNDVLASLSRLALGVSLITSYPLLFMGLRNGIFDLINQVYPLFNRSGEKGTIDQPQQQLQEQKQLKLTDRQSDQFTIGLVAFISILAVKITDITFVSSFSGALTGTSLIFIFPPLMFRSALTMESKRTNIPFTRIQRFERRLCSVIVALGVFIAGVGARMAWIR